MKRFVLFIVLMIVPGLFFAGKAYAANVYNANPCADGDITLDRPYKDPDSTKTYRCIAGLSAGDWDNNPDPDRATFKALGATGYIIVKPTITPDDTISLKVDCNDSVSLNAGNCAIIRYLTLFTRILSGIVGIVIVIMIIFGGIQYSMATDDPQKIQAARTKITNALLALLVFLFMFAFLQWLVPGGVL